MTDTQAKFIEAATELFAERGFYGVSLANVADKVGLTKQALIHHFGTKEKLYGVVLERLSARFMTMISATDSEAQSPEDRLIGFFTRFFQHAVLQPQDVILVQRELLDNKQRADEAGKWYLKPFLNALIGEVQKTENWRGASDPQALAVVYQFLGAVSYFATSRATLARMYGEQSYLDTRDCFPSELQAIMNRSFAPVRP